MVRTRSSRPPAFAAPKVLVVDDVPGNLLALEVLLEGLDCVVETASSGSAALELLLRETYAVILLDVRMPIMDGYEVARHARMHSRTRDLPIIFMTAESPDDEHLRLGYGSGAVDFLFKPINREIFRSKVRVFVDLFCSRRELSEANARLEAANSKLLALVDAEATASRALRQANDELGLAYRDLRATQSQFPQSIARRGLDDAPPEADRRAVAPVLTALERIDGASGSLTRLRDHGLLTDSADAEAEWEEARAHLNAAALQLARLALQNEPDVMPRSAPAGAVRPEESAAHTAGAAQAR